MRRNWRDWCGPHGREGQFFWSRVKGARVKRELSASVVAGRGLGKTKRGRTRGLCGLNL
jgi:hypothetical protein